VLYLSKHGDVKGLELMSAFRGECKDEDVVIVCNCPELIGFMRVVVSPALRQSGGLVLM
jgi:hypothetical protein